MPQDELEALETYLEQLNLMPGCGEYALSVILEPGAWSTNPLWRRLQALSCPMCFLFGDQDWVPSSGAHSLAETFEGQLYISYISDSSHNIHFDNPVELVDKILFFINSLSS